MAEGGVPQIIQRCNVCYVNILNGMNHTCISEDQRKKWIRTDVYATTPRPLFELRFQGEPYFLDENSNEFLPIHDGHLSLSPQIDGYFRFNKNGYFAASYLCTSIKHFSIVVASLSQTNQWHLLFRVEINATHGLKFYKLDFALDSNNGRIVIPSEYNLNTALFLGVANIQSLWMDFYVFANTSGEIDYENFNGYEVSRLIGNPKKVINSFYVLSTNFDATYEKIHLCGKNVTLF